MYSRAIVTSQNIVGELCYVAKKLSEKGNFPNYIGQQSCFLQTHFNLAKYNFQKKFKHNLSKKRAADEDKDLKPQMT